MFEAEEYLSAASELLGLPIRREHYEAVLAAFEVLCEQGRLVTGFELPAEVEAAPRFVA